MNAFQVRLELLKMSLDMIVDEHEVKKQQLINDWSTKVETARAKGETPPEHPDLPTFPSAIEIIEKAKLLNDFVSGPSTNPIETKTSKK